jgi:hypothetical protein
VDLNEVLLRKTERQSMTQSKAAYINQRMDQMSGKAVKTARPAVEVVTNTQGQQRALYAR